MSKKHCLIFGSNESGFHGAGAAGFAFRGDSSNNWRSCPIMQAAIAHGPGYKGLHAVFGISQGYQEGTIGSSYAIQTVSKPGYKRSVHIHDIEDQVFSMIGFIDQHPDIQFCLTKFGAGYAGYTEDEMKPLWDRLLQEDNVRWAKTS